MLVCHKENGQSINQLKHQVDFPCSYQDGLGSSELNFYALTGHTLNAQFASGSSSNTAFLSIITNFKSIPISL